MCAIAGHIDFKQPITPIHTKVILSHMTHRGPDESGIYHSRNVVLGMNRLSIIDVKGGHQPIISYDKSKVIVGNGEIYNFQSLRNSLPKKFKYATGSDIEVALHAYHTYGLDFAKHLRGMFALAIYDKANQKLILTRDRLGEKPVYYTSFNHKFYFASELKAILQIPGINKSIDPQQIYNYLYYQYIPECKTPFQRIHKLEPGHTLVIDLKTHKIINQQYWFPDTIKSNNHQEPVKQIRQKIEEAITLSSYADVEVGVSLSGGLDSGTILALYSQLKNTPISAITIGYEGNSKYDESSVAVELSKSKQIKHHVYKLKTSDVIQNFPKMVYFSDEPIADIAGSAIMAVSKIARKNGLKVLLGGLGGDELFWGYPWVRRVTQKNIYHNSTDFTLFDQTPAFKNAQNILSSFLHPKFKSLVDQNQPKKIFQPQQKLNSQEQIAHHSLAMIRDHWLIPNCVELNDRLSMANSVELRAPFLDFKLFSTVYHSSKITLGYKEPHKYWMKEATKDLFDEKFLNLPKQGFTPPVGKWLYEIIKSYQYLFQDGFLVSQKIITPLLFNIMRISWLAFPRLWSTAYQLLVLEIWGRIYIHGQDLTTIKPK